MANTAHKSGGSLSGAENPTVVQKLLDNSIPASGITEFPPAPSSVPGWEGDKVLAARVTTFKASPSTDYTQNPIHSANADSIPLDNPSVCLGLGRSVVDDSELDERFPLVAVHPLAFHIVQIYQ